MNSWIIIFLGLLISYEVIALEKYIDPEYPEVETYILFRPENCTVKSKKGDMLDTDYIGTFLNGVKFDSTYDRNKSMVYTMGNGDVIKGCEIATMNMCVGEKRRTIIPAKLAYGDKDYGQIPAGSTLCFDIVLTALGEDPFKTINFDNIDDQFKG